MNFEYNETQRMIADSIKDFAEQHIRPNVMEWDEKLSFLIIEKGSDLAISKKASPFILSPKFFAKKQNNTASQSLDTC